MKAIVYTNYGPPDVLRLKEVEKPVPKENEVLIKVHATTVNRTDCATIRAKPFFMRIATGLFRPKKQLPGTEIAGEVEAVGTNVSSLQEGDKVFGFDDQGSGAHAEYMTINEEMVVTMPDKLSYEQAAGSFEGVHYAYNFINKVDLQKGDHVLIKGATGDIGSAAVQLLNDYDVNVTAVCATENMELVKTLGADRVIDYTKEDFTQDNQTYVVVFDTVGKSSFFKSKDLLKPGGVYLSSDLGYLAQNIYLPFITPLLKPFIAGKKALFPMPVDVRKSLLLVKGLIEEGKFKAVVDRTYPFEQIAEAYRYVEKGHKTGNVVITVEHSN